jgi:uncharacterized protein YkwD
MLEPRELLSINPTPFEQAMLEDLNRARIDPAGELAVIFSGLDPLRASDPEVQRAVDYFNVDRDTLLAQWSTLETAGPLAWNEALMETAFAHNQLMQAQDDQKHQLQGEPTLGERVTAAGYDYELVTENVYAFAESHIHAHAGFIIDWGDTSTGIQQPPGHRINIMNDDLIDVGISVIRDTSPTTGVGPYLVTQDFGQPLRYENPFLLGVAWNDHNENDIYDPGEGLSDVSLTISGDGQTYQVDTMDAGGYQVRVAPGTYSITATSNALGAPIVFDAVVVGGRNVKVDFLADVDIPPTANNDTVSTTAGSATQINVLLNDVPVEGELDPATVTITQEPANGRAVVDVATGRISYTPNHGFVGPDSFRYTVSDVVGGVSNEATVSISVAPIEPVAVPDFAEAISGQSVSLDVLSNDTNVDSSSSIVIDTPAANGTVRAEGTTVIYVSDPDFVGFDTFQYHVLTADGQTSNITDVSLAVADPNQSFQNPLNPLDVNGDGVVAPIDALLVINELNTALVPGVTATPPWVDVNGDNAVSPVDALLVINQLGSAQAASSATAIGPRWNPPLDVIDSLFSLDDDDEQIGSTLF